MSYRKKSSKWITVALVLMVLAGAALFIERRVDLRGLTLSPSGPDDVLVMLALPGEDGVVLPRVANRYQVIGDKTYQESIDLLQSVTIPGTIFDRLRDIYSFEGGSGLAKAISQPVTHPAYVVLDFEDLQALLNVERMIIEVPEQMDVYDGEELYTFRAGQELTLTAHEAVALLMGAEYLPESARQTLLFDLGTEVGRLMLAERLDHSAVETDLDPEEYEKFLEKMTLFY